MANEQNDGELNPGQPGADGGNPNPNPNNGAPADKGVGGKDGTNTEKTFSFKEDRTDWVPRHRLNDTSGKLTEAEKRAIKAEGELEAERKRTRALAGLEPSDPKKAESEEIRSALYQMFPQLKALENLTAEQLQEVFDAAKSAQSTSQAAWARHATGMLNDLETEAGSVLGVEKLTPTQQNRLRQAYRDEAASAVADRQRAMQRGERESLDTISTDNDFVARHERGDKTLIKEFVKGFLDDWFEPARRSVTASAARRNMRPIPRGERTRMPITQGTPKVDLNNTDEFKKALLAARGSSE